MFDFAEGHGQKEFGFGKGQSYCAAYGRKVLETGGAKLKDWNVEKLMKEANKAIMTYGPLALKYVENLIEKKGNRVKGNRVTATILFFLNTELIRSLSPHFIAPLFYVVSRLNQLALAKHKIPGQGLPHLNYWRC